MVYLDSLIASFSYKALRLYSSRYRKGEKIVIAPTLPRKEFIGHHLTASPSTVIPHAQDLNHSNEYVEEV